MSRTPRRSTRGPRSRNLGGSHACQTWAGSTTWSSTLMILGIAASSMARLLDGLTRGAAVAALTGEVGEHGHHVAARLERGRLDPLPLLEGFVRLLAHVVPVGVEHRGDLEAKPVRVVEVDA